MNESPRAEVAIVGAGITGVSIAWHLAQHGVSVAVYDGKGVGSGATAIQPGGVRQQWGTRIACLMAREAYAFYTEMDARLQSAVDPGFSSCGYMFVAHTHAVLDDMKSRMALQNELGIPSQQLTPDEVRAVAPGVASEELVGAVYCERDGYFARPQAVVAAFADAARRGMVDFVDRSVIALRHEGDGWRLDLGRGETGWADQVVVAAAYDTPTLLEPLGIHLPIVKEPRYLFYSSPIRERLLEPLVVAPERHFAAKHLADGCVLASDLSASGDPAQDKAKWYSNVRRTITELVPILEYVAFPVMVEGFYDVTPDRNPVFGPLHGHDGLWVAAGLNGRGLMMAPVVGRTVAEGIISGGLDPMIAVLAPTRFDDDQLIHEAQVV